MQEFLRRPIRFRVVLRFALQTLLYSVILGLLSFAWNSRPFNAAAEYHLRERVMPAPNAHDLYMQASAAFMRGEKPVAQALDYSISQDEAEQPGRYPLQRKLLWLQRNKRALELFDAALRAEYMSPALDPVRARAAEAETRYALRWLARCITVQCQVLASTGRKEQAVHRALDIWKMGLDSERGAPTVGALNAQTLQLSARRALDGEIAHLTGSEAARAAARLESLLQTRVTYLETMQNEHGDMLRYVKRGLEEAAFEEQQAAKVREAYAQGANSVHVGEERAPEQNGPLIHWSSRRLAGDFHEAFEKLLADAESDWPNRSRAPIAGTSDYLTGFMAALQKYRFQRLRSEAAAQLTLARLQLHAFRKDKGRYPDSLDELRTAYPFGILLDPFSSRQPLRYKLDGRRYKLWSIGPDATDNGADPMINPAATRPGGKYLVTPDATGDIVANIHR